NLIRQVRSVDVPDLRCLTCISLPIVARDAVVYRLQLRSVGSEKLIVPAIAEEEIQARSAVKLIVVRPSHHSIQPRIFEGVQPSTIIVMQAALRIYEYPKLVVGP